MSRALCVARACSSMYPVTCDESLTGRVLAIAATVVNPPAAAARRPLAMVSFWGKPGSRSFHLLRGLDGLHHRIDHRAVMRFGFSVVARRCEANLYTFRR